MIGDTFVYYGKGHYQKVNLGLQLKATRNSDRNLLVALLFLDLAAQKKIYIQGHNNMDLSLFSTFFTKFYSLRNRGLQVTDI